MFLATGLKIIEFLSFYLHTSRLILSVKPTIQKLFVGRRYFQTSMSKVTGVILLSFSFVFLLLCLCIANIIQLNYGIINGVEVLIPLSLVPLLGWIIFKYICLELFLSN